MNQLAFLGDVIENPDDDGVRLIFADWLEENGDPERAEFIRTQVTLHANADGRGELPTAEIARLERRKRALLRRHKERWLAPLRELKVRVDLQAPEPNTWHELLAALDANLPVAGLRVAVQEYGAANPQLLEGLLQPPQLLVGHVLQVDQARARAFDPAQQLVELQVDGLGVAVLGVLDHEDHQAPAICVPLAEE